MEEIKKQRRFAMNFKTKNTKQGFTLIELLVVIAIIGLLASVIIVALSNEREKARDVTAQATIKQLQIALELYYNENGFYPPDVNRGWDPGLSKPLPYNTANPTQDCNVAANQPSCVCGVWINCDTNTNPYPSYVPANWMSQVSGNGDGPYIAQWPLTTPWGGEYDYNYWDTVTTRNGCNVPAGIYLGIESGSGFTLSPSVEQDLFNEGIDNDGCPNNGEAQLLLVKL